MTGNALAEGIKWNSERMDEILGDFGRMKPVGSTGIPSLDEILGGGLYPEVYVLAAEPGAGKTTLALQVADYVAQFGNRKVVFVTMEMSAPYMVAKSLSRLSAVRCKEPLAVRDFMRMGAEPDKLAVFGEVADIYREEIAGGIAAVDEKVTVRAIAELYEDGFGGCELPPVLMVDYLQIMPPEEGREAAADYLKHAANMRGLCEIAKRHRVPVIVISSKNRAKRDSKSLDALSGSSGIEYDAYVVMYLSLDGENEKETKENAEKEARAVTLSVVKNRFWRLGDVGLVFKASESRFIEKAASGWVEEHAALRLDGGGRNGEL